MAQELIKKGLERLTPIHSTVLVLACMEGLSMREIADIMDVSDGTVKSRLYHAKKNFLEFLNQNGVLL
jgi:RNA polymerase sigma-70 factor (ECF subfamily)